MIAWYIVPYKLHPTLKGYTGIPVRYCAIDDYMNVIYPDGKYAYLEVLGNRAIVKVKAPDNVIALLDTKLRRLPDDLSVTAKQKIKDEILDMGYREEEIGEITDLKDAMKIMATRKIKPSWDSVNKQVIFDGVEVKVTPIEWLDEQVK